MVSFHVVESKRGWKSIPSLARKLQSLILLLCHRASTLNNKQLPAEMSTQLSSESFTPACVTERWSLLLYVLRKEPKPQVFDAAAVDGLSQLWPELCCANIDMSLLERKIWKFPQFWFSGSFTFARFWLLIGSRPEPNMPQRCLHSNVKTHKGCESLLFLLRTPRHGVVAAASAKPPGRESKPLVEDFLREMLASTEV